MLWKTLVAGVVVSVTCALGCDSSPSQGVSGKTTVEFFDSKFSVDSSVQYSSGSSLRELGCGVQVYWVTSQNKTCIKVTFEASRDTNGVILNENTGSLIAEGGSSILDYTVVKRDSGNNPSRLRIGEKEYICLNYTGGMSPPEKQPVQGYSKTILSVVEYKKWEEVKSDSIFALAFTNKDDCQRNFP